MSPVLVVLIILVAAFLFLLFFIKVILGLRTIKNEKMGIVQRWWSPKGSLKEGIVALNGEAGFLPDVLRGGIHVKPRFVYKVHIFPLIMIPQGQMAYVFARSGDVLPNAQLLGRIIPESDNFQDVRGFLEHGGQKGPQRGILREGTYSLNLAQFVVLAKDRIYYLPMGDASELEMLRRMQADIEARNGFEPIIIRSSDASMLTSESYMSTQPQRFNNDQKTSRVLDLVGIVTVQDGPSLPVGEIIAPIVGGDAKDHDESYHNNFQNPESFLSAGGFKGRQLQVLTEGSYFLNRLFCTIEYVPKTVVPVGFVGVVVSYTGTKGTDVTGESYKHGELVERGSKGVWQEPLMPGKYAINPFAMEVKLVPTTNIILKWVSDEVGEHKYDENLKEVELITRDAFQPSLPLSVVLHIDYKRAPWVIQRFGDMDKLVNQTLDPLISSYFKNVGQTKTLIELIQQRRDIQEVSTVEMRQKFQNYNLELEEVLIGTPQASPTDTQMNIVLEQLRQRQVAEEKVKTFESQQRAAEKEKLLKEAVASAEQQSALTASAINIKIEANKGAAEARKAEQDAIRIRTIAQAEADRTRATGQAEADKIKAIGIADATRVENVGKAEATAIAAQVKSYGGPRYQLTEKIMAQFSKAISEGKIDIVPKTLVNMGGSGEGDGSNGQSAFESLIKMLLMGKLGVDLDSGFENSEMPEEEVK